MCVAWLKSVAPLIIGTSGDYYVDGKSDLVPRSIDLGVVQVREMNGTDIAAISSYGASGGYSVVGTHGDYNGDGKSDILFRDSSSLVMFQMNGTDIGAVGSYTASSGWTVVGTDGDYNGDGKSDILLRNDVLANPGSLSMWQMNGTAIDAFGSATVDAGMRVVGSRGDYNGDGMSDIALNNPDTGALAMWLMNGMQVADSTFAANLGAGWTVFA